MTKPFQTIPLYGHALTEAIAALRARLMSADVATVRFLTEEANDGGHRAVQLAMVRGDGGVVGDRELRATVLHVLSSLVDERVPGWDAGDGGRSQIDWAVGVDAMDHRHYDNVKFERRRVLGAATLADSSEILADNAQAAMLLAMGDVAPTDRSATEYLRRGLKVLADHTRADQARFLSPAQRDLLIEGIAGTRLRNGNEDEWVTEVVTDGFVGYEHAPDVVLVQKLATEALDDVVEGVCGPLRIFGGSDQELNKRRSFIEVFTLPQSLQALEAVAETRGDDLLQSLPELDEDEPEAAGQEAPAL